MSHFVIVFVRMMPARCDSQVGSLPVAIADFGNAQGLPLLVLHGAARNLEDWSAVAEILAERYRVVAIDFRNHGASGDGRWQWDAVLDDIQTVLNTLDIGIHCVAGHSLGGMVAAMHARRHQDCMAAINLDGHGNGRPEHYDLTVSREEIRRGIGRLSELSRKAIAALAEPMNQEIIDQIMASQPQRQAAALARMLRQGEDGVFTLRPRQSDAIDLMDAVDRLDLPALYRETRCPLLVVKTTRVDIPDNQPEWLWVSEFLAAYHRGLCKIIRSITNEVPDVTFQEVETGHGLLIEEPEFTAQLIEEFLRSAGSRS